MSVEKNGPQWVTCFVKDRKSRKPLLDPETGEVVAYSEISVKKTFDGTPFVKVYRAGFDAMFSLGKPGQHVMKAVVALMAAHKNENVFLLTKEVVSELAGEISAPKFHTGINDLIAKGIVTREKKRVGKVEVNPSMLWNGVKRP